MDSKLKTAFIKTVKEYYKKHGRHDLPWRLTIDPYKITVSEVMLQQTQVARVIEKYHEFLKAFPTVKKLATAPLQEVLLHWSGLGYNRRARFLQRMAQSVIENHNSIFPQTFEELLKLPGVGHYTAGAISAFAYNKPITIIETNIRTVYLHHFTPSLRSGLAAQNEISDKELLPLIEQTLDVKNPREWYWALMDYGSYLKSTGVKIHRTSAQYKKQKSFKGSLREVRGGIVKILTKESATAAKLEKQLSFETGRIEHALQQLLQEEFIIKKGKSYSIK
ncbi:MAG: A/G-specific adenine glycosylase [Candidatus Paceibacterota bacterium]